jgi:murein DD-endopeptidase MepM/ murein hydrolase activator NlpD
MHKEGYISTYAHCSQLISKPGDHVTKKDIIALLGNTGRSTGPHVHVEIERHGKLYNPLYFIW